MKEGGGDESEGEEKRTEKLRLEETFGASETFVVDVELVTVWEAESSDVGRLKKRTTG